MSIVRGRNITCSTIETLAKRALQRVEVDDAETYAAHHVGIQLVLRTNSRLEVFRVGRICLPI
jgi:hypothetical protein